MKKALLFCLQFSFLFNIAAQSDSTYQTLIAKAGLFHLKKDYKSAIMYFEKAFQLHQPDALNAYKAASAYSLDSNIEKGFFYLERALKYGWTEANWLSMDTYFDYLRNFTPERWKVIEQKAFSFERRYEQTLERPSLRKQINLMTLNDQMLRYKRAQSNNENEIKTINEQIIDSDQKNLDKAKAIIGEYGWPGISEIGRDGQNNLWLIVQHADQDLLFQQTALIAMKKLEGTHEINPENYAFLYDRIKCNLNYKQFYGTQVVWTGNGEASGFRPIINEGAVDERRKKMGMVPLKIYAQTYGFTYYNISARKAKQNDSTDIAYTRNLLDSARYFYTKNNFQQVYDYYNNASMIQGGMTDKDNFQAAIIFSKIASVNNEQQYKDIALDFLNLLYLRRKLVRKALDTQSQFTILHEEKRWVSLYNNLK